MITLKRILKIQWEILEWTNLAQEGCCKIIVVNVQFP
jgi:hypothetical protein